MFNVGSIIQWFSVKSFINIMNMQMIYSFHIEPLGERAGQIELLVKYYMQQMWFDYGLELKYVCLFLCFNILSHFKVFNNIHTYAN